MSKKKFWIYNTMSRKKEEFVPLMAQKKDPSQPESVHSAKGKDFVGIYSC